MARACADGVAAAGDGGGRVRFGLGERLLAEPFAQGLVADDAVQGVGVGVDVPVERDEDAVPAVGDDLAGAVRAVGGDDGHPAVHGLDDGHAEGLHVGGDGGDGALGPLGLDR